MSGQVYTIQQIAERFGMTAHTLRYYERVGLIRPVDRARNGHRRYSESDVAWIDFLHNIRAADMPIREMQHFADLRAEGDATLLERCRILEAQQQIILARIETLRQTMGVIDRQVEAYKEQARQSAVPESAEAVQADSEDALCALAE